MSKIKSMVEGQMPLILNYSLYCTRKSVFVLFCFLAVPCGLWDLSSLIRDRTQGTAVRAPSRNNWTAREFPGNLFCCCCFFSGAPLFP